MDARTVPTLKDAVSLCAGTAHAMSEAARLPYCGQAEQEINEHDERLSDNDFPNPVTFAHEISGLYLLGAGDFVLGMHLVVDPSWNLRLSLPSLARSACEYSAISWMLSRDELSAEERLAKMIAVVRHDIRRPGSLAGLDEAGQELGDKFERWISRQRFLISEKGLPPISDLQEQMLPGGKEQYKDLSGLVHGRLLPMLRGAVGMQQGWPERELDSWVEVLIATSRGLAAAVTVANLRGGNVDHLAEMWSLHRYFSDALGFSQMLADPWG